MKKFIIKEWQDKYLKEAKSAKELIKYFRRRPAKGWSVEEDRNPNDPWVQFDDYKTGLVAMFNVKQGIWYLYKEEAAIMMSDVMKRGTWKTEGDVEKILLKLKG